MSTGGGDGWVLAYCLACATGIVGGLALIFAFLIWQRPAIFEAGGSEARLLLMVRWLAVVTWLGLGASVAIVFWGSNRGFDFADEGYYWMCYTHFDYYGWGHTFASLGNKLISWLHLDMVTFRWLRFLLLFGSHLLFAFALVQWLQGRVSFAGDRVWLRRFGFVLLLSSVTMPYIWGPLTMSYNDWACALSLVAGAMLILVLRQNAEPGNWRRVKVFALAVVAGLALGWLAFVKWPAVFSVGALLLVAALFGLAQRRSVLALFGLGMLTGFLVTMAVIHAGWVNLEVLMRAIHDSITLATRTSHNSDKLLANYWQEFRATWLRLLGGFWWVALLLTLWPSLFYQRSNLRTSRFSWVTLMFRVRISMAWLTKVGRVRSVILLVGVAGILVSSWKMGFLRAGQRWATNAMEGHLALALLCGVLWLGCRLAGSQARDVSREVVKQVTWADVRKRARQGLAWLVSNQWLAVILLLLGLPWAIGFGTGNRLLMNGAWVGVAWKGLLLIGIGAAWRYRAARVWGLALGALSVMFGFVQFYYGHVKDPYRYPRLSQPSLLWQAYAVPNLPRARGLLFDAETASFLRNIADRYHALGLPQDYPIMGFYDWPGLVYLLEGLSPSVPWYFNERVSPGRTRLDLLRREPLKNVAGSIPKPVILVSEDLNVETMGLLNKLGIAFPSQYTNVITYSYPAPTWYFTAKLALWVPNEAMAQGRGK